MNSAERKTFIWLRDMKPDSPHFKSKVDFMPTLAKWLAREISTKNQVIATTQNAFAAGRPVQIIGQFMPFIPIASICSTWDVQLLTTRSSSLFEGTVRCWCQELGLNFRTDGDR
jgi:hypothetical protein